MILDTTTIALLVLFLISLIVFIWIAIIDRKLSRFMRGKNNLSFEDSLNTILREINNVQSDNKIIKSGLDELDERITRSIQGVHVVRFNPFKGSSGSNQSFCIALLNENKDGVIVSSLYSRERVSIFSKPVKDGSSEYELTNEEKEALKGAIKKLAI